MLPITSAIQKQPKLDLIIAVDDLKAFHNKNIQKDVNGKDYTYLARMTKGKIVTYFQQKGARVHFNHTSLECPTLSKITGGEKNLINLRYGIVEFEDMVRDLKYWETLLTSSFM